MSTNPVKIDAALNPNDGRVYFFINDKIIAFDEKENKVINGYPVSIDTEWKGLFENAPEAACLYPNGYIYFFKDDKYIRSTIKTKKVSAGYPKPIKGNWKDLWEDKIDACIAIGDFVYFFRGKECLKYGAKKGNQMHGFEGPKPIPHYFPGLWEDGIDAAVNWHAKEGSHLNDKIYFFKGEHYMRFDVGNNSVDNGYPMRIRAGWAGLEDAIHAATSVLREKNQVATLPSITNLTVKLRWFKSVDFDLAVFYVLADGTKGRIYFGNRGNLTQSPFVFLNKDDMYGEENEEIITIKDLSLFKELYIICWDYSNSGGTGVFDDADVNVSIVDNLSNSTSVFLKQESGKDAACIAKVYLEGGNYKIQNLSKYFRRDGDTDAGRTIDKIISH